MARIPGVPYDGPPRGYGSSGETKMYIAIHNTSNNASPKNEASYAKTRTDDVSSHFYADADAVIQSLDTSKDAWHAASQWGNRHAIAFELVGFNSSTEVHWKQIIDRVAPVMAQVCKIHSIPVQSLSVAQAKTKTLRGFVTHYDMTQAWGGTHNDPGPNFPEAYLISKVKAAMNPVTDTEDDDMFEDKDRDALTSINYRLYAHQQDLDFADFKITSGREFHDANKAKVARVALEKRVSEIETKLATLIASQSIELSAADRQAIVEALRESVETTTTQAVQAALESLTGTTTFAVE